MKMDAPMDSDEEDSFVTLGRPLEIYDDGKSNFVSILLHWIGDAHVTVGFTTDESILSCFVTTKTASGLLLFSNVNFYDASLISAVIIWAVSIFMF